MFLELDPPAIEIVPENNPWNVLEIVQQNDTWSVLNIIPEIDLGIDLGINLRNALQNVSMRSRDRTSIPSIAPGSRRSGNDPVDKINRFCRIWRSILHH